ncbi:MAG: tRNA (adenine-N1)-methyltransferase [archaeon]
MIKKGDRVLLIGKKNYLVTVDDTKFSTEYGTIDLGFLAKKKFGIKVTTHKGEKFNVVEPRVPDLLKKIKRLPQIVMWKDVGIIAAKVGLTKDDVLVEAGTGSAGFTIAVAGMVKELYTYELREDFYKVAKANIEKCGCKNVHIKNKDITKGIAEKDVDVVMLDMSEPAKALPEAHKALKPGGFVVGYCPTVEQAVKFKKGLIGFGDVETLECIIRDWEIGEDRSRPVTIPVGHTGFLTFARKL